MQSIRRSATTVVWGRLAACFLDSDGHRRRAVRYGLWSELPVWLFRQSFVEGKQMESAARASRQRVRAFLPQRGAGRCAGFRRKATKESGRCEPCCDWRPCLDLPVLAVV